MASNGSSAAWQRLLPHLDDEHRRIVNWMQANYATCVWLPSWSGRELEILGGHFGNAVKLKAVWKRLREMERLTLLFNPPNKQCRYNRHAHSVLAWDISKKPPTVAEYGLLYRLTKGGSRDAVDAKTDDSLSLPKIRDRLKKLQQKMLDTVAPADQISDVAMLHRAVQILVNRREIKLGLKG